MVVYRHMSLFKGSWISTLQSSLATEEYTIKFFNWCRLEIGIFHPGDDRARRYRGSAESTSIKDSFSWTPEPFLAFFRDLFCLEPDHYFLICLHNSCAHAVV